jgi:3-methyladenine DNA glycosylase AlkC
MGKIVFEMEEKSPALKDWFDQARFRAMARTLASLAPAFDQNAFLLRSLAGLEHLNLLSRMRRMTESIHSALPGNYLEQLDVLRKLAPRIEHPFVTMVLPDFVGQYGLGHFDQSLSALEYFTRFGSSEFAIRIFLKKDFERTLPVLEAWSLHMDEHVRRLSCEGLRPRLPWSFRLDRLIQDPALSERILENLKDDPSLYVRKSVANHLNDISKDHPAWVLQKVKGWDRSKSGTAWIVRRALRTLVKKGDQGSLELLGARKALATLEAFTVSPPVVHLGSRIELSACIRSQSSSEQLLVVDYAIHYVKKSGGSSAKVFKWKQFTLGPREVKTLTKQQMLKNFTTRLHYPGKHQVDLLINGKNLGSASFALGTGQSH